MRKTFVTMLYQLDGPRNPSPIFQEGCDAFKVEMWWESPPCGEVSISWCLLPSERRAECEIDLRLYRRVRKFVLMMISGWDSTFPLRHDEPVSWNLIMKRTRCEQLDRNCVDDPEFYRTVNVCSLLNISDYCSVISFKTHYSGTAVNLIRDVNTSHWQLPGV